MDPKAKPFTPKSRTRLLPTEPSRDSEASRKKPVRKRTVIPSKPVQKGTVIPSNPVKALWDAIQQAINSDDYLTDLLLLMNEPVMVIDYLNQVGSFSSLSKMFRNKIGMDITREEEYILSTSLHSIGCHRGECRGEIGIQKLRLEDPFEFKVRRIDKRRVFADLAFQAPEISFIEVSRETSRSEDFYQIDVLPDSTNLIKIIGNGRISKEIDDMITVALFLRLTDLGKESYIQSCDKFRWMFRARFSNEQKRQVKENQVMPYFLAKEMMDIPAIILMGYECAYDCTTKQNPPHNAACMLISKPKVPKYI